MIKCQIAYCAGLHSAPQHSKVLQCLVSCAVSPQLLRHALRSRLHLLERCVSMLAAAAKVMCQNTPSVWTLRGRRRSTEALRGRRRSTHRRTPRVFRPRVRDEQAASDRRMLKKRHLTDGCSREDWVCKATNLAARKPACEVSWRAVPRHGPASRCARRQFTTT